MNRSALSKAVAPKVRKGKTRTVARQSSEDTGWVVTTPDGRTVETGNTDLATALKAAGVESETED